MKRLFIVVGLFSVLAIGVGWSVNKWVPWWRVEGRAELEGVQVKFSRVKLAWVLGQLGVWEKGVRVNEGWQVPKEVAFVINANTYNKGRFIDGPSGMILYSANNEFVDADTLLISIGLPSMDFFGEPKKMTAILNNQTIRTMVKLIRDEPVSSAVSFETESEVFLRRLPKQVANFMITIQ